MGKSKLDSQFWRPEPGTEPHPMPRRRKKKRPKAKQAIPQWKAKLLARQKEISRFARQRQIDEPMSQFFSGERPFWAT